MKIIKIGDDPFQNRPINKIEYESEELPKIQLFNASDVIAGNPTSNVAIGFIYTWKLDSPPKNISKLFQKLSVYSALTGLWRTTNGGRYVFSNILANPNINKLVLFIFDSNDNGHKLVDAVENMWLNGINSDGVIINSKASNPKFEQVPIDAIDRIRKQADLIIVKNVNSKENLDPVETFIKTLIQEPENAKEIPKSIYDSASIKKEYNNSTTKNHGSITFISRVKALCNCNLLYDDGARFKEPFYIDLTTSAKNVKFEEKNLTTSIGRSIQTDDLSDAINQIASFVYKNGSHSIDMRGLHMIECRSFSITVMNPLNSIPSGFTKEYINTYVDEFMNGINNNEEFRYTYHERIFKTWGNQVSKAINDLKDHPNTRRALISLWDQTSDIGNASPPCLDMIWLCIRNEKLEMHAIFRSHHLATVTRDGKLMEGEGAFVPNTYALATLQKHISNELSIPAGPITITDFSGHIHVTDI